MTIIITLTSINSKMLEPFLRPLMTFLGQNCEENLSKRWKSRLKWPNDHNNHINHLKVKISRTLPGFIYDILGQKVEENLSKRSMSIQSVNLDECSVSSHSQCLLSTAWLPACVNTRTIDQHCFDLSIANLGIPSCKAGSYHYQLRLYEFCLPLASIWFKEYVPLIKKNTPKLRQWP